MVKVETVAQEPLFAAQMVAQIRVTVVAEPLQAAQVVMFLAVTVDLVYFLFA
jgi:hypothetical protein